MRENHFVPVRHVTDQLMRLFIKLRQTHTIKVAAAKAYFSCSTGFRISHDPRLPSQKMQQRALHFHLTAMKANGC